MKDKNLICKAGSISLPSDMWAWVKRNAAKQRTSVSGIVKQALLPSFEKRHKK